MNDFAQRREVEVNLGSSQNVTATPAMAMGGGIEPHIDFELDVKIFFNSGKCVLHTKDQVKNEELSNNARNYSASEMANNVSPSISNNGANLAKAHHSSFIKSRSSAKLTKFYAYGNRRDYYSVGMNPDFTVFLIPGLDIKLHYSSKSIIMQDEDRDKEQSNFRNSTNGIRFLRLNLCHNQLYIFFSTRQKT